MGLAEGSENLFSDSKFSGAFLLVLRVWLEDWGAWAGRVVVQEILFSIPNFRSLTLWGSAGWGVGLAEGL